MAFFFKKFPKTEYAFINDPKNKKTVTNILTAFFLRKLGFNQNLMYESYVIKDNDTLESLSNMIYKTPLHYWTILVVNDIIDPYTEWAMPSDILEKFTAKKYKDGKKLKRTDGTFYQIPFSAGIEGIHHFFNIQTGRQCDEFEDAYYREMYELNPAYLGNNIIPVSNLSYESDLNLKKRQIYLVNRNQITSFEEDFNKMLSGRANT
jgi:hypothetical protein